MERGEVVSYAALACVGAVLKKTRQKETRIQRVFFEVKLSLFIYFFCKVVAALLDFVFHPFSCEG